MIQFPEDHTIQKVPSWDVVDSTKLKCYLTCPRKYFYEYVLGWRRALPNNHLVFGEAWHLALEYILTHGYSDESFLSALRLFSDLYLGHFTTAQNADNYPKNIEGATEALMLYIQKYRHDSFEVLATEIGGSVLVNIEGDRIYYRLDAIVQDKRGIFALEHKTAGNMSNSWMLQWPLNMQMFTYNHVLYSFYPPEQVRGVIINATEFRKYKSKQTGTRFNFLRMPIRKDPYDMQDWLAQTNYWMSLLKNDYEKLANASIDDSSLNAFYKNSESCSKYFGCEYHGFCTAWPNPLREAQQVPFEFEVSHWNPMDKETKTILEDNGEGHEKLLSLISKKVQRAEV